MRAVLLLLGLGLSFACKSSEKALERPLFYAIQKGAVTSYILGTMHMGIDAKRLPPVVLEKLDASPVFAMETDLADPRIQAAIACTGCSLRRELSAQQWKTLSDELGASTARQIDGMQPMVAVTALAMSWMPKTEAMDTVLFRRADKAGKRMVYLEDAAAAAGVLKKWMDLRALKMMLDDIPGQKASTRAMVDAYVAGDEIELFQQYLRDKPKVLAAGYTEAEYEQQVDDILYARNAAWIAGIEEAHAKGGVFIAVGALHLSGPKNVRELLEARGYQVTRISP